MKYAIILLAASAFSVNAREYVTYITQTNVFPNPNGNGTLTNTSIIADIEPVGSQTASSAVMGRATFQLIADEVPTEEEIANKVPVRQHIMDTNGVVEYDISVNLSVIGPAADPHNASKPEGVPARTKVGQGFSVEYDVSGLQQPGTIDPERGDVWPLAATELKLQHVVDDFRNSAASTAFQGRIASNGITTVSHNAGLAPVAGNVGDAGVLGEETFSVFILPDADHPENVFQDEGSILIHPKENGDLDLEPRLEPGVTAYRIAPSIPTIANNVYPDGKIFVRVTGGALTQPLFIGRRRNTGSESANYEFTLKDLDSQLPGSGTYTVQLRYVDYFYSPNNALLQRQSIVLDTEQFTLNRSINVRGSVFSAE